MSKPLALIALAVACNSHAPSSSSETAPARRDIPLARDANGAYWDATERALYLTEGNALVRWTDAAGFSDVAQLGSAGVELGGLARLADGSFAITSFGFGSDGGVFVVGTGHPPSSVPNLDKARRRIGIAVGSDGAIYDTYFVVVDPHAHHGGVAMLDLGSGETDVVTTGLSKPVGIAAVGSDLLVSDQDGNVIDAISHGSASPIATSLPSVDLLTVLPDGSLVTGGRAGSITEITRTGTQRQLATGFEQVRGTAYDAAGKRLFVVEHGKGKHVLHILSLADSR